jgi:hypothetical protein
VVDVKVVTPDASGEDVDLLPVGGLLSRGHSCITDQFRHFCSQGVS